MYLDKIENTATSDKTEVTTSQDT